MKKIILITLAIFTIATVTFSQAKKPTLMVVPSDAWCFDHGYFLMFENQGKSEKIPDYKRAFQENHELGGVVDAIGELMTDRGFPLKRMESALKTLASESAEDAMLTSKSGAGITENPIDKLKKTAKADIWMQVDWKINEFGPTKSVTYRMTGVDAYTDKGIAGGMEKTGNKLLGDATESEMLKTAILSDIDGFNVQLMAHFDDMFKNGREIIIRIKKFDSWPENLEKEYEGKELNSIIEGWLTKNCVQGRFSTSESTENMMLFEQVRIPMFDAAGIALDARGFCKGLQKFLKAAPYLIENKLMMKGLGQASIVLGEK